MTNETNEIKMKYALKDLVGVAEIYNDESGESVLEKLQECGYTEQEAYDIWTIASYGYEMPDPFPRELLVEYRKTRGKLIKEKQRLYGYDPSNHSDASEELAMYINEKAELGAAESLKLPIHHGWNVEAAVKALEQARA